MSLKKNIFDGWVTTIIGIITMLLTLLLLFIREINFVWEGIAGLSMGTILLIAPKTIEKVVLKWFDKSPIDKV